MSGSAPGRREVAYRLFAAEFDDAEFGYSESDEERAPNYVVTPTGARVNRLFAVGVLTEVDDVNPEMVRGRVVDPTGAFVTYAGQYQPDALAFLERAEPPAFVALTGKARTFEPDDDDVVYSSVRPESVNTVDADTRDRWVVTAAERTLDRVGVAAAAIDADLAGDRLRAGLEEAGVDERLADGVALALEYYDTTPAYLGALRETALDAGRVVAGERDEARPLDVRPDAAGGPDAPTAGDLATLDLSGLPTSAAAPDTGDSAADAGADPASDPDEAGDVSEPAGSGPTTDAGATDQLDDADTAEAPTTDTEPATDETPDTEPATDETPDTGETTDVEPDLDTEPATEELADTAAATDADAEPGDFDPGEFELDDETREEVEEEYGTEFSTADEVEEADVESPEPDTELSGEAGAVEPGAEASTDDASTAESVADDAASGTAGGPTDAGGAESAETDDDAGEVDLEDAVMAAMETADDGDGADRETLVDAVVDEHGADPEAVEAAIEDALMSGRCYEPSEGTLKAI